MGLSLKREPALILIGALGPLVAFLVSFADGLGVETQTALNAVAVAVAGLATAWMVHREKLAPAILGVAQAVMTFAMARGLDLDPEQQAGFLTVAGIIVAAFVRTQVPAPVDELGQRRTARHAVWNDRDAA